MIKKFFILVSFVAMAATGFSQVSTVRFLLQPDGTFKTEDGQSSVVVNCDFAKSLSPEVLQQNFYTAVRQYTNGDCQLLADNSITVQNCIIYRSWGTGIDWYLNLVFKFQPSSYTVKIYAPHGIGARSSSGASFTAWWGGNMPEGYFKKNGTRYSETYDGEEQLNAMYNNILAMVLDAYK